MNPTRMIFEDAPAFIPVPPELQHHRVEAILWPLEDAPATIPPESAAGVPRRSPSPELAGKVREFGDVTPQAGAPCLPSLADFRATLPVQTVSAGDFCRSMRDEDRY